MYYSSECLNHSTCICRLLLVLIVSANILACGYACAHLTSANQPFGRGGGDEFLNICIFHSVVNFLLGKKSEQLEIQKKFSSSINSYILTFKCPIYCAFQ